MWSTGYPFIPVFVHQVGNDDAGGFRKVRMFVCRTLHGLYLGNEKEFLTVGREREPFDVSLVLGQLLASAAVGIHFPYLAAAAFVAEEGKLLAVLEPCGLSFLPGVMRYLGIVTTVGIHDEDFAVTLVLGHAVIGYRVGNLLFVGGYGYAAASCCCPASFVPPQEANVMAADISSRFTCFIYAFCFSYFNAKILNFPSLPIPTFDI